MKNEVKRISEMTLDELRESLKWTEAILSEPPKALQFDAAAAFLREWHKKLSIRIHELTKV
jgi:hypothetical protein